MSSRKMLLIKKQFDSTANDGVSRLNTTYTEISFKYLKLLCYRVMLCKTVTI